MRLSSKTFSLRLASLGGEYWITAEGDAIFADGDAGVDVPNHEAVVIQYSLQEVMDNMESSDDPIIQTFVSEMSMYSEDEIIDRIAIREALNNSIDSIIQEHPELEDSLYNKGPESYIVEKTGLDEELVEIAFGGGKDERAYAMEKWGWIRLAGNALELWKVTPSSMGAMARGLWEAHDEDAMRTEYDIWEATSNKWYNDVHFLTIDSKKPAALHGNRQYGHGKLGI